MGRRLRIVTVPVLAAVLIFLILGPIRSGIARHRLRKALRNLTILWYALRHYEYTNGRYPASLNVLCPGYITPDCFEQTMTVLSHGGDWHVVYDPAAPTNRIVPLCWQRRPHRLPDPLLFWRSCSVWCLLFTDGHCETVPEEEIQKLQLPGLP